MTTVPALMQQLRELDVRLSADNGRLRISAPKGAITSEIALALKAHKTELLALLLRKSERRSLESEPPVDRTRPMRLSYFQERVWMLNQLSPDDTSCNFASLSGVADGVDIPRLSRALCRVVADNEILRSRFLLDGQIPVVRIGTSELAPIVVRDLSGLSANEQQSLLNTAASLAAHERFDLAHEAGVRFTIFKTAENSCALLIATHHIVMDAWSLGVLRRTIRQYYDDATHAQSNVPATTRLQYVDYAAWQRNYFESAAANDSLEFWTRQLKSLPQFSTFDTDVQRTDTSVPQGATIEFRWPSALYARVRALAVALDATTYMVLVGALAVALSRATGQTDIALGSPFGTRDETVLDDMLGPIVNLMVVRVEVDGECTFADVVSRTRNAVLDGHAHKDVPFDQLVQRLRPARTAGSTPLFQVAVVMHAAQPADDDAIVSGGSMHDLTVFAVERDGALEGSFEFRADLYRDSTIARIIDWTTRIVAGAVSNPELRVTAIPILTKPEADELLAATIPDPVRVSEATVAEQFETIAKTCPDAVAVVARDTALTYKALNDRSNALAAALRANGVTPGSVVALACERSSLMMVGVLGILKAAAVYLPIDLSYPTDRLSFIVSDSGAGHIVTTGSSLAQLSAVRLPRRIIRLDDPDAPDFSTVVEHHGTQQSPAPSDVAYLMYTSGSTGQAKGVRVSHAALSNFLFAMCRQLSPSAHDRMLAATPTGFDISLHELFLPLITGGQIVLIEREDAIDGARLSRAILQHGVTIVQATPTTWRLLKNANWSGSANITAITGGESVSRDLVAWLVPRVKRLWNGYGPTETTIWSTFGELSADTAITIGIPVANTRVYVLDSALQPVPVNMPGEICIAGDGLALGYHNRPDLTAQFFVPEFGRPAERMYRTGDVGRWRPDRRLEYLGRVDGQVKLRGYRIEVAEIEQQLCLHTSVSAAVVDIRSASDGDNRLVAWVRLLDGAECTLGELRTHLRSKLPEFMIPSTVLLVDHFPLTPSGKVARKALPEPFLDSTRSLRALVSPGLAPRDSLENQLAAVWQELLTVPVVGVRDNFFDAGGHSLLAARLLAQIDRLYNRRIPVQLFFANATIERLAALIRTGWTDSDVDDVVVLNVQGTRRQLFFFHGDTTGVGFYGLTLAQHLGSDQPLGLIPPIPPESGDASPDFPEMSRRHFETVRRIQPHGPYRLAGYCNGGLAAYEVARMLEAAGEQVERLFLLMTTAEMIYLRTPLRIARLATRARGGSRISQLDRLVNVSTVLLVRHRQLRAASKRKLLASMYSVELSAYLIFHVVYRAVTTVTHVRKTAVSPVDISNLEPRQFNIRYPHMRRVTRTHMPGRYSGKVTLFWTRHECPTPWDVTVGWTQVAREVEVVPIKGDHNSCVAADLEDTARAMREALLDETPS